MDSLFYDEVLIAINYWVHQIVFSKEPPVDIEVVLFQI